MFSEPVSSVLYCYGVYQKYYDEMKIPNLELHEGLPDLEKVQSLNDGKFHVIVLDDLMEYICHGLPCDEPAPVWRRVSGRRPYHQCPSHNPYAKSSLGRSKRLQGSLCPVSRQNRSGSPLGITRSDVTPPLARFPAILRV